MSSIMHAIYDDIEDYKRWCKRHKKDVQFTETDRGILLPDCYGDKEYNKALKKGSHE